MSYTIFSFLIHFLCNGNNFRQNHFINSSYTISIILLHVFPQSLQFVILYFWIITFFFNAPENPRLISYLSKLFQVHIKHLTTRQEQTREDNKNKTRGLNTMQNRMRMNRNFRFCGRMKFAQFRLVLIMCFLCMCSFDISSLSCQQQWCQQS